VDSEWRTECDSSDPRPIRQSSCVLEICSYDANSASACFTLRKDGFACWFDRFYRQAVNAKALNWRHGEHTPSTTRQNTRQRGEYSTGPVSTHWRVLFAAGLRWRFGTRRTASRPSSTWISRQYLGGEGNVDMMEERSL
jgi:hypothetical protein